MYKILIVEDEEYIRKGLIYLLPWEKMNCCIAGEAANGEDGLKLIETTRPDIVISDIRMPGMDGLEMLECSMGQYDFEAVILSGYSDFEYAKKGISLGVRDYITKPLDFDELRSCICRLTEEREKKKKDHLDLLRAQTILEAEAILDVAGFRNRMWSDPYTEKLAAIVEENYEKKITLTDISRQLNISASYLNAKFKADTGYTFNSYLNRYRIVKAIQLLTDGSCLVYEAAEKTGFYDYKYFIKVFKKYVGCTPFQFRSRRQG